jgi:hypothetical protein
MRKTTFVKPLCCCMNLFFIAALGLSGTPLFSQDAAALPSDPKELMLLAGKMNSLTGPGMQPWRLKASLHIFTPSTSLSEEENKQGKYEELWAGGDKFKQTYSDEEYSQTVYATPNGQFIAGRLHFILGEVHQLNGFFEPAAYLRQYAEGHNPQFDPADAGAGESACLRTVSDRPKDSKTEPLVYRFCFDSSHGSFAFPSTATTTFSSSFVSPSLSMGARLPLKLNYAAMELFECLRIWKALKLPSQ